MIKSKKIFVIGIIILILFFAICLVNILLENLTTHQEFWLKIAEILTSCSATLTLSLSISINIDVKTNNTKNTANQLVKGNDNTVMTTINNNDPVQLITAVRESLIPYEEANIQKICEKTFESLKQETPNDNVLNKDFVLKYISESANISDEDIQDIWVKLLIQERRETGSISKRTLDIVKNLYPSEARIFERVTVMAFTNGMIYENQIKDIPYIEFSKLEDIGLLKTSPYLTNTVKINPNGTNSIVQDGILFLITNSSNTEQKIQYSIKLLTSEGLELKKALGIGISSDNFLEFCRDIKDKNKKNTNLTFSAHEIINVVGTQVSYQTSDIL